MPAFTEPSLTEWQRVGFLNEIMTSYNEHRQAIGQSVVDLIEPGDNVQLRSLWSGIQSWINTNCVKFVDHDTVSATNPGTPYSRASFAAKTGVAISGSALTFKRSIDGESFDTPFSMMAIGDIIGPWIFEEIQKCFDELRYTGQGYEGLPEDITLTAFERQAEVSAVYDTPEEAYDAVVAAFNAEDETDVSLFFELYFVAYDVFASGSKYGAKLERKRHRIDYNIPESDISHSADYYASFDSVFLSSFTNLDGLAPDPVISEYSIRQSFESANTTVRNTNHFDIASAPAYAGEGRHGIRVDDFYSEQFLIKWDWTYTLPE